MWSSVVVGLQYGDEGKGKIVDLLAKNYEWVVRYQGGNNAGHTIYVNGQKIVLHQIPSGVFEGKKVAIGNGCVVNEAELAIEIEAVTRILGKTPDLWISPKAHLVTQDHIARDVEANKHIGTTGRGIGPAYSDKVNRKGVRLAERSLSALSQYIRDPLPEMIKSRSVLFEGAQGTLLDIDHGTYPFVTSSSCTAGGASTGTGYPPHYINEAIGVAKCYTTRVGNGYLLGDFTDPDFEFHHDKQLPFYEFPDRKAEISKWAEKVQEIGKEFGATTGRPRRVAPLNLQELEESCMINGVEEVYMTKFDVLYEVGTAYIYRSASDMLNPIIIDRKKDSLNSIESFVEAILKPCRYALPNVKFHASVGPNRDDILESI